MRPRSRRRRGSRSSRRPLPCPARPRRRTRRGSSPPRSPVLGLLGPRSASSSVSSDSSSDSSDVLVLGILVVLRLVLVGRRVLGLVVGAEDQLVDERGDRLAARGIGVDGVGAERCRHRQDEQQGAAHDGEPGSAESFHASAYLPMATPLGSAGRLGCVGRQTTDRDDDVATVASASVRVGGTSVPRRPGPWSLGERGGMARDRSGAAVLAQQDVDHVAVASPRGVAPQPVEVVRVALDHLAERPALVAAEVEPQLRRRRPRAARAARRAWPTLPASAGEPGVGPTPTGSGAPGRARSRTPS